MIKTFAVVVFSALALTSASAADLAHGRHVFGLCGQCHLISESTNLFGPTLKGVFGRKAGSVPGYQYSQAMLDAGASGLVWDDKSLAEFLYSPRRKVPGTKMGFWGLWTDAEINDVIAFLKANP